MTNDSSYSELGQVTLIEPNARKLEERAIAAGKILPNAKIQTQAVPIGEGLSLWNVSSSVPDVRNNDPFSIPP